MDVLDLTVPKTFLEESSALGAFPKPLNRFPPEKGDVGAPKPNVDEEDAVFPPKIDGCAAVAVTGAAVPPKMLSADDAWVPKAPDPKVLAPPNPNAEDVPNTLVDADPRLNVPAPDDTWKGPDSLTRKLRWNSDRRRGPNHIEKQERESPFASVG